MSESVGSRATVRSIEAGDRDAWAGLYRGFRDFYKRAHDEAVLNTVWDWLMDPAHEMRALIAEVDALPVGIGHFYGFPRPIDGGRGLYLEDLFTAPEARGAGAASAILHRLAEVARDENALLVRWNTDDDNHAARRVYDRITQQTSWVTYDLAPAAE